MEICGPQAPGNHARPRTSRQGKRRRPRRRIGKLSKRTGQAKTILITELSRQAPGQLATRLPREGCFSFSNASPNRVRRFSTPAPASYEDTSGTRRSPAGHRTRAAFFVARFQRPKQPPQPTTQRYGGNLRKTILFFKLNDLHTIINDNFPSPLSSLPARDERDEKQQDTTPARTPGPPPACRQQPGPRIANLESF